MQSAATPSLWRHPGFTRLWAGQTVSVVGTQVTLVAVPLVALKLLGASTFEVGLLVAIERLPVLLVGLPAGAIVDRRRRRPVLIAGDVGRALALGSVPLAYWAHALTLVHLYAAVLVTGLLTVFFDVAYQSYLPALVEPDQLVDGNAKLQISESGAQIGGPALAGVLFGALRAGAIAVDALSYVWSAVCLLAIRTPEAPVSRPLVPEGGTPVRFRSEIAEGVRYVWNHPYLRPIAACTGISNLFSTVTVAVFFTYAVRVLHLSAATIGVIIGVGSVGFLLGAVVALPLARRFGIGRTIVASACLFGPPTLLVPLAPVRAPVPWLVVSFLVGSVWSPVYNITQVSLRQTLCPPRLQGRMNATMRFVAWGTMPIGGLVGGVLGTTIGLRRAVLIGAVGQMAACIPLLRSAVGRISEMPEPEADEPAAAGEGGVRGLQP